MPSVHGFKKSVSPVNAFLSKEDLKTVEKAEALQSTLSTKLQEAKIL